MENEIYRGIVLAAFLNQDLDYPIVYTVTKEANCVAIWFDDGEASTQLIQHFPRHSENDAIEAAVLMTVQARALKMSRLRRPS